MSQAHSTQNILLSTKHRQSAQRLATGSQQQSKPSALPHSRPNKPVTQSVTSKVGSARPAKAVSSSKVGPTNKLSNTTKSFAQQTRHLESQKFLATTLMPQSGYLTKSITGHPSGNHSKLERPGLISWN